MTQGSIICWFDLPVIDIDRAILFYSQVLAAKLQKEMFGSDTMAVFPHTDTSVGGCLFVNKEEKPSANGLLAYFDVNGRLDNAITAVNKYGGKVLKPKHQIGPHGFRAVVLDSEGNRVALHSK